MNGTELQRRRRALGLSQPQMARQLHISVRTLESWEQGRRQPTSAGLLRLALDALEARLAPRSERGA